MTALIWPNWFFSTCAKKFPEYTKLIPYTRPVSSVALFEEEDAITRTVVVENHSGKSRSLKRVMSLCLDLPDGGLDLSHKKVSCKFTFSRWLLAGMLFF